MAARAEGRVAASATPPELVLPVTPAALVACCVRCPALASDPELPTLLVKTLPLLGEVCAAPVFAVLANRISDLPTSCNSGLAPRLCACCWLTLYAGFSQANPYSTRASAHPHPTCPLLRRFPGCPAPCRH